MLYHLQRTLATRYPKQVKATASYYLLDRALNAPFVGRNYASADNTTTLLTVSYNFFPTDAGMREFALFLE